VTARKGRFKVSFTPVNYNDRNYQSLVIYSTYYNIRKPFYTYGVDGNNITITFSVAFFVEDSKVVIASYRIKDLTFERPVNDIINDVEEPSLSVYNGTLPSNITSGSSQNGNSIGNSGSSNNLNGSSSNGISNGNSTNSFSNSSVENGSSNNSTSNNSSSTNGSNGNGNNNSSSSANGSNSQNGSSNQNTNGNNSRNESSGQNSNGSNQTNNGTSTNSGKNQTSNNENQEQVKDTIIKKFIGENLSEDLNTSAIYNNRLTVAIPTKIDAEVWDSELALSFGRKKSYYIVSFNSTLNLYFTYTLTVDNNYNNNLLKNYEHFSMYGINGIITNIQGCRENTCGVVFLNDTPIHCIMKVRNERATFVCFNTSLALNNFTKFLKINKLTLRDFWRHWNLCK